MPSQVLIAIGPGSVTLGTRTQEGFIPALEFDAVAAGHEQSLCQRHAVAVAGLRPPLPVLALRQRPHRVGPAALNVARREPDQEMRGAKVRLHLVCVELLARRIHIREVRLVFPVNEILGGGGANGAPAAGLPVLFVNHASGESTPVGSVFTVLTIPEGEVLRIKRTVGNDGRLAQRRPMQAVRRFESKQRPAMIGGREVTRHQRLITSFRWRGRVLIFEHGRLPWHRHCIAHLFRCKDDVIGLRSLEFMQAQGWLFPMNPVLAFSIAAEHRVLAGVHLARRHRELPGLVVHAKKVAILEDAVIPASAAFPRFIVCQCNLLWHWVMKPQLGLARKVVHKSVIHEHFATGSNVGGCIRSHRTARQQRRQDNHSVHDGRRACIINHGVGNGCDRGCSGRTDLCAGETAINDNDFAGDVAGSRRAQEGHGAGTI